MADQKISVMPTAAALTGAELVPIVQSGANAKVTIANFGAYARTAFSRYGDFIYSDGPLTAAANTVTSLIFNGTGTSNGVAIGTPNSRIVVTYAGLYSIIISLQLSNSDSNYDSLTLWASKNGTDVANTASVINVPAKKGSTNGLIILTVQFTIQLAAADYIQFKWSTDEGHASIVTVPASLVAPIHPAAPGIILSVIQIA